MKYITTRRFGCCVPQSMGYNGLDYEEHKIYDAGLRDGAKLHRIDRDGLDVSAIYQNGEEVCSCLKEFEGDMLEKWNIGG